MTPDLMTSSKGLYRSIAISSNELACPRLPQSGRLVLALPMLSQLFEIWNRGTVAPSAGKGLISPALNG